ncbi:MAG: hypothetical protein B6I28_04790 [Fusobacteriia bacterium 4572_132]|nr:MAG: hypothetical protein B6I28_04790 [Fusobacteriia bacterium 4572_132]
MLLSLSANVQPNENALLTKVNFEFNEVLQKENIELKEKLKQYENQKAPWQITTNIYFEVEKFEGHRDIDGDTVYDKLSPTTQLFLNNPDSKWSYFAMYQLSLRNRNENLESTDNSFNRNRFQVGATRKIINNERAMFNLNFTYRKESNDSAPGTDTRGNNNLYWIMPSGSYKLTDKLSFSYWDAFYYYDHFQNGNSTEWESEHGFTYKINKKTKK